MFNRPYVAAALFAALALSPAAPALAQGEILITQAKANAGNVTPGDAAGFPVTLSAPGSYILASNLQAPANKAGIRIASHFVDIDMNGFLLRGAAGATTGIYGANFQSATIRNGTVTGFAAHGVFATGKNWIVEDMRVVENGAFGISITGAHASIRNSSVTENGNTGISCGNRCLVEDSTASQNGGEGIQVASGTVLGNVIFGNAGFGIDGGGFTGYGNNTLAFNNGGVGGPQVDTVEPLHPNFCSPACP